MPDRHCALPVSMWPGSFGEEKFGKGVFYFICVLSKELIVISRVMKRAQTDSRDCSFVIANQYLRVGSLP